MQLKQINELLKPTAYFTGERYGGGNVYDEENIYTLINNNATLGASGSTNTNLSNRSININGGHLQILDATFFEDQVGARDFQISFGFRIPDRTADNPIAGFKPIIQKWSPEQEYWIGFEDGDLTAHLQTDSGIVSLEYTGRKHVYNNRWNHVTLRVTTTVIELWFNGLKVANVSNTGVLQTSSNSIFTVGGIGSESWIEDLYVADICLHNHSASAYPLCAYRLTRSNTEMWLDTNPTHLYMVADQENLSAPIPNLGSAGGNAYLVYDLNGTAPYHYTPYAEKNEQTVRMPANSWINIDHDLTLDFNAGVTMMFRGRYDEPDSTLSASHSFRIADIGSNYGGNEDRLLLSYNYYSSSSNRYMGFRMHDSAGTEITSSPTYISPATETADTHYIHGIKMFRFHGGDLYTCTSPIRYWYNSKSYSFTYNYQPSQPITYNRFWWNTNAGGSYWSDLSEFALYDYPVRSDVLGVINYPSFKLKDMLMQNVFGGDAYWTLYGLGTTSPNVAYYSNRYQGNPLTNPSGHSFATGISDPLFNRSNEWLGSVYLADSGDYIGGSTGQDDIYIQNYNFTLNIFVWNRNTTSDYLLMYNTSGLDLEVRMNRRDGEFSHGDVTVSMDRLAAGHTFSTHSAKFKDDGFHMLTIVRKGLEVQIWVDGELDEVYFTSSITNFDSTNTTLRVYGGPCYINEFTVYRDDLEPHHIEYLFGGFHDTVKGQATLDGSPLPSTLLAASTETGEIMKTYATGADGKFDIKLPKTLLDHRINLIALAQDDTASNNVVVHGPYNLTTVYSKHSEELLTQSLSDMILDMNPYAYYPLNETTGTTVNDASPNARHATLAGGVTLDQEAMESGSKAFHFDGTDGHIDLPDGYDDMSQGFTMEAWVNFEAFNNNSRIFDVSTNQGSGHDAIVVSNSSYYGTTDGLAVRILNSSAGDIVREYINGFFTADTWVHICIRVAKDGTLSIWKNGNKEREVSAALPPNVLRTVGWIARTGWGAGDGYFQGKMSNHVTYPHALSDEDIEKHAKRGFGYTAPTLRAAIMQDDPELYFTFDRTEEYTDVVDGQVTLNKNGSFDIERNSLVINKAAIANNWLTTPDYRLSNQGEGWTIELAFKSEAGQTNGILVSEWNQAANAGTYKVEIDATNTIKFYVNNGTTLLTSSTTYDDAEWHHVMITYDGDMMKLYVDGNFEASLSIASITYNQYNMSVGNASDGHTSTYMDAITHIDDLAIYSYDLNAVRVAEHYTRFTKKKVYQ